jgi:hypothetical protein
MINVDYNNGTIVVSDSFDLLAATGSVSAAPAFNSIGAEYVLTFSNITGFACFNKFFYDTLGLTSNRYLETHYRVSRDGNAYSEWFPLSANVKDFPSLDTLHLQIRWRRAGVSTIGSIRLLEYSISGEVERKVIEDDGVAYVLPGESVIVKAPYIYKVFKLTGHEVIAGGVLEDATLKWRYSQDNSRTWSKWEPLTDPNVSTAKINPIRFFQVEFLVENGGNSPLSVRDINLLGDFQNVSKDYFKSNLMGIRDNCMSNMVNAGYYDQSGNFVPYANPSGVQGNVSTGLSGDNCQTDQHGSTLPAMSNENKAGLYNPYQQNAAMSLLNKLSTDAAEVFGHRVIYFATDPDRKGTDMTMHEYQLYNVSCEGELKISVEGNNFPDSQIVMNQFDLNLFSTMEVHITKKMFKEVFGPQRRPSKEDFIYFCQLNRMYSVDHAQQFRNFNNSAVSYKLILKKYNKAANFDIQDSDIRDKIKQLTKNSTLDELMGIEKAEDKVSIANKQQFAPLTRDPIRHNIVAKIKRELIENSSTIISKSHYDLSTVELGETAVSYNNVNPYFRETDNLGYMIWFNINNYVFDDVYYFFSYYDQANSLGWQVRMSNDRVSVVLNGVEYDWDLLGVQTNDATALDEEVWYCYVLNLDQRQRTMSQWIYKRDVDDESKAGMINSTILRKVYSDSRDMVPFEALVEGADCLVIASDMRATNIRLFNDVIPEDYHDKLLNQMIVGNDSRHLVFADNANMRIDLPRYPLNE